MLKPQELFHSYPESTLIQFKYIQNSYNPFVPKLQYKYNLNTLPINPTPEGYQNSKTIPIDKEFLQIHNAFLQNPHIYSQISYHKKYPSPQHLCHPYEQYLTHVFTPLSQTPNQSVQPYYFLDTVQTKSGAKIPIDPPQFSSLQQTPFNWIDTVSDFNEILLPALMNARQLAIDLEHHSWRTYLGLTSLMQISTREQDFILDTLALWGQIHRIAPILANPNVVKVMHGADSDILWLQRDFGLYIVNLFDTGRASRLLQMSGHGFGYILEFYCGVKTDKKYQLADWRIRPLNEQMMLYARMDTHYLLYIYDRMRIDLYNAKKEELMSSNNSGNFSFVSPRVLKKKYKEKQKSKYALMRNVWEISKKTCLQVYTKPELQDKGYQALIDRNKFLLDKRGMKLLKLVLKWRDFVGRMLDENPHFILKNSIVFQIVKNFSGNDGCMYIDLERTIRDGDCGISQLGERYLQAYTMDLFKKINQSVKQEKNKVKKKQEGKQADLPVSSSAFRGQEQQKLGEQSKLISSKRTISNLSRNILKGKNEIIENTALKHLLRSQMIERRSRVSEKLYNPSLNDVIKSQVEKLQLIHGLNLTEQIKQDEKTHKIEQGNLQLKENPIQPVQELIRFDESLPASIVEKRKEKKGLLLPRKAKEQNEQQQKLNPERKLKKKMVQTEQDKAKQIQLNTFRQNAQKLLIGAQKTMNELKNSDMNKRKIKEQSREISRKQKNLGKNIKAPNIFGSQSKIDKGMHFNN